MIVTVTLNPAIDKTLELEELKVNQLNRVNNSRSDVGGKGINVAKVIKVLDGDVTTCGFLGEKNAQIFVDDLNSLQIDNRFILVKGETRTNLKIINNKGELTEINESGFIVEEESLKQLEHKLLALAKADTTFVLSGSLPKGIDKDIYAKLTNLLKEKGSKVIVDADGELLKNAIKEKPYLLKPNKYELYSYLGKTETKDIKEIINDAKSLLNEEIENVVVSLGGQGALFLHGDKAYYFKALKVELNSTVGAGDSMVAALAYAIDKKYSFIEACKLAMACSAAAVTTKGTNPPPKELIKELLKQTTYTEYDI